ncbi:GntR family transcriptional regulator [Roseovarius pelagicus]|uniref:GntR family transcriptional regulator n=1 Tax=Roseovarius pelagicus TaxID=2980108 RepID=A0ABY6DBV2_9RHOB|nr:GntR family transcriptional regulator [Roseovarius pelagicus]UXX83624.1 GntR family transcriptional regulator [Roseovarius pelagicus]
MKEISKDSLGHTIYGRVCQDLVRGKLRPNQKITIRGLADALGTSSTPVRDAVQRLLQDNALDQRSVRDVRVPVLSTGQYMEISRMRVELEGLAAAKAAEVAAGRDVARLQRIIARNEEAIAADRWPQAAELNQQFHFALAEIAQMPVLLDTLHRLWLRMGPLIASYYASAQEDMVQQHHAIVSACERRDPDAARAAMRADIKGSREGIIAYITSLKAD